MLSVENIRSCRDVTALTARIFALHAPRLRQLRVAQATDKISVFTTLLQTSSLVELRLCNIELLATPLSESASACFERLEQQTRLEHLEFSAQFRRESYGFESGLPYSAPGALFKALLHLSQLKTLDLAATLLNEEDSSSFFSQLDHWSQLQTLAVPAMRTSAQVACCKRLVAFCKTSALDNLSIKRTVFLSHQFCPEALGLLADFLESPACRLRSWDISGIYWTCKQWRQWMDALGRNRSVQELRAARCGLNTTLHWHLLVTLLEDNSRLTFVDVNDNSFSHGEEKPFLKRISLLKQRRTLVVELPQAPLNQPARRYSVQ